jgi:hypothetical protein
MERHVALNILPLGRPLLVTRGFSLPHGNASVKLISVAMQPILAVPNIGRTDVECEWRKPTMPNQVQSVSEGPAPGWRLQPSVLRAHRGGSSVAKEPSPGQVQWNIMSPWTWATTTSTLSVIIFCTGHSLKKNKGTWGMEASWLAWCCRWRSRRL